MLSLVLVGFIAQLFYSQDQGFINGADRPGRAPAPDWLGDPKLNLWAVLIAARWRHVGYIMVLYLAGLKSVDPSLRDAAKVDGASEWQTFRRVIFPVLRPINIVVLVVTVIESLRAFDIVYVINGGKNGLELLSVLVYDNIVGEASRIGYGSAIGTILLVLALGFIITYLVAELPLGASRERGRDAAKRRAEAARAKRRSRRSWLTSFLTAIACCAVPGPVRALHVAAARTRTPPSTATCRSRSTLTFDNYSAAWSGADLPHYYFNSLIITVPAIVLTLLLASFVAFSGVALQLALQPARC